MKANCRICKKIFTGREGKLYCSLKCKNEYNAKLRRVTKQATGHIDDILHRNRSILLEILGKANRQKKVQRLILDKKKFNYKYVTQYHLNSRGKMVNYIYDFSWMEFSDQEILIKRIR